tara:strand:- start:1292 stop:3577 length:2286 start_codon:yes stop_codon:yes gene_type:complete
MAGVLEGSDSFSGINWWIGQVAPRETWAENTLLKNDKDVGVVGRKGDINVYPNRVKVRVVGYHDQIEDPNDLPFASVMGNPFISSGYGAAPNTHQLEGGESVLGIWIDGEDEQKPVITNVFMKSQHAVDGGTTDLKSNSTTRQNIIQSTSDINSRLDSSSLWATELTGDAYGEKMFSGEFVTNYDFSKSQPPEVSKYTKQGKLRTPAQIAAAQRLETKKWNEFLLSEKNEGFIDVDLDLISGRNAYVVDPALVNNGGGTTGPVKSYEETLAEVKTDSPSCKRDNIIGVITGAIEDFTKLLINVEKYGEFYVNAVTGMVVNFQAEMNQIARKIAGALTGKINNMRDYLFGEIEEKINAFTNKIIPEELKPKTGEAIKNVTDTIYCLFGNVIDGLKNMIGNFLKELIGKIVNVPLCAAEQLVGTLLNDVLGSINDTITPILSSLTSTLGGALGSVTSLVNKALEGANLLFNFLACDDLKCPLPSRFDNTLGPQQKQKDRVDKIMEGISGISGELGLDGELPSIFKKSDGDPSVVASLVGGCDSNILRCGPPTVELFGGSGVGGVINAVVAETTEIVGANILDRGLGYKEKPPYVVFRDACGDGKGARAKAIINPDDGGIDGLLIEASGYGYNSNFDRIITTSGILDSDTSVEGDLMTGQINSVVVAAPGFGYNSTDTIDAGNADLSPIVLGGRIVGVKVNNKGSGFTNIPELRINTETGRGADLRAVLNFVPVSEVSETLDPTQIISVVDCVDKPLTRNPIGE